MNSNCCHHDSITGNEVKNPTMYTCPMHPQIKQKESGNCPICGMALEPQISTNDDSFIEESSI